MDQRRTARDETRKVVPTCHFVSDSTSCVYLAAEDSTSGLCHTPGTREGVTSHRGSNPLSSAMHKTPVH